MARSKWIFLCSSSFLHLLYHTKMMTNLNLLKLEIRCMYVLVHNWKTLLLFLFPIICTKEIQKRLREAHLYFFLIHILRFWQVCFPTDTVTSYVVRVRLLEMIYHNVVNLLLIVIRNCKNLEVVYWFFTVLLIETSLIWIWIESFIGKLYGISFLL